jgi:hypothetical protein
MVKTNKKINLAQLDVELGLTGLSMSTLKDEHTITPVSDKITLAQLEAAIFAHIAQPYEADKAEAAKAAAQAKLAALGLTTDDLKALGLGGN